MKCKPPSPTPDQVTLGIKTFSKNSMGLCNLFTTPRPVMSVITFWWTARKVSHDLPQWQSLILWSRLAHKCGIRTEGCQKVTRLRFYQIIRSRSVGLNVFVPCFARFCFPHSISHGRSLSRQSWGMKGWAFEEHMIMFLSGGPSQILARTGAYTACLNVNICIWFMPNILCIHVSYIYICYYIILYYIILYLNDMWLMFTLSISWRFVLPDPQQSTKGKHQTARHRTNWDDLPNYIWLGICPFPENPKGNLWDDLALNSHHELNPGIARSKGVSIKDG